MEAKNLYKQIKDVLDAATYENGYPHEFGRPAEDIVAEINDWSGIEGYNPNNSEHAKTCVSAVELWRIFNTQNNSKTYTENEK